MKRVKPSDMSDFMLRFRSFASQFKSRWGKCRRTEKLFLQQNANWLNTSISFVPPKQIPKKRGRKNLSFEECKGNTKAKKCKEIRDSIPLPVLCHATQMSLRASGQIHASQIVKEIVSSPTIATQYKKGCKNVSQQLSAEEALTVLVDAKLTRSQYNIIRKATPEKFPSYTIVQQAKQKCYPKRDQMKISETSAQVSLQGLLDHTIERLAELTKSDFDSLNNEELLQITLYTKWGFDGSSGHSSYKQAFHGNDASDSAVFITSIVPLKLTCNGKTIWQNPRPSSTRFCRPLKIEFLKETQNTAKLEKERIENEIKTLMDTTVLSKERIIKVNHILMLVMIDGKVCNAITDTSSTQRCYLCGATSKEFNSIDNMIARNVNTETLQFGLSVLHGWIRFFECLIHLSYKIPIKKWQARSEDDKEIVAGTKRRIQTEFRELTGLIIDQPKPGFGNSNDGNTARRFFQNPEVSATITNVDVELIKRMHMILIAVSCGHEIHVEKFRNFCYNTARQFVNLYPWFYMPPTLHKFFIHGPEIVAHALLPIGQLSEEAQEARNKDFKNYREHYARKCSRENMNEDIFNRFLLTSDPLITSKSTNYKKKVQHIPQMALDLLNLSNTPNEEDISNVDYEDDENEDDEDEDDYDEDDDMI